MFAVRTRAALYLTLIFLCGALAGVVGTRWAERSSVMADSAANTRSGQVRKGALVWFTQELTLNPEQVAQLTKILEETRSAYKDHEIEIESIKQHGRVRIREILTEEQKPKFDQLLAERAQREKERERLKGH
jgi:Spy/CpxP family protein refolding chaperone